MNVLLVVLIASAVKCHRAGNEPTVFLDEYDFIIAGSGSAGSAIASRLSQVSDWKILLLEAGRRPNFFNDIPVLSQTLQTTDYNWHYKMEKTPGVCLGYKEQQCHWPHGKGLGGSTLINYMIYNRGNHKDYDKWAGMGNPGWSYKDVLPYFKKSEKSFLAVQDEGYHGKSGPVSVEDIHFKPLVTHSFLEAGKELGYKTVDYNGRTQEGFSYIQANTRKGVRDSAYTAYIKPAESRSNFHVSTKTRVTKVLIDPDTNKAYGVEFVKNRKYHKVNASKEVIVSAGTMSSPQILMLSGIGAREHLESFNITVVQDLPGVGENLQDHVALVGVLFKLNASVAEGPYLAEDIRSFLQWISTGTGPMSSLGGIHGIGFMHTNVTPSPVPDIELIFAAVGYNQQRNELFKLTTDISDEMYEAVWKPLIGTQFWFLIPMLLHPKSKGCIRLKSKDPFAWPKFYGNYFSDPDNLDAKTLVASVREIQRIAKTDSMRRFGSELHDKVILGCEEPVFDSDEYWECAVRQLGMTLHHQIGTCKMGPSSDPMSVVDHEGRVHGVGNLRVADISIVPESLSAHMNAPAYMIGEKIADIIQQHWNSV